MVAHPVADVPQGDISAVEADQWSSGSRYRPVDSSRVDHLVSRKPGYPVGYAKILRNGWDVVFPPGGAIDSVGLAPQQRLAELRVHDLLLESASAARALAERSSGHDRLVERAVRRPRRFVSDRHILPEKRLGPLPVLL